MSGCGVLLLRNDIQPEAVDPFHYIISGGAAGQTCAGEPIGTVGAKSMQIGRTGTYPAAAAGAERDNSLAGKIITFHEGVDDPGRLPPPNGVA